MIRRALFAATWLVAVQAGFGQAAFGQSMLGQASSGQGSAGQYPSSQYSSGQGSAAQPLSGKTGSGSSGRTGSGTVNTAGNHVTKPRLAAKHTVTRTSGRPSAVRVAAGRTEAGHAEAGRPAPTRVAEKTGARHVPVVVPKHRPPARTAVAAAKKVAIRKDPPAPKPVAVQPAPAKPAPPPVPADVGTNTGLHLPRYASLKSDDVNMRVGPAERYPVIWTYKRRELPVKIEREFDIWRLVEDMDGVKGWVHQATLTGRRTFVVTGLADRTMRADASETADAVAILKPGVVGRIKSCEAAKDWCQVQVADYRGWLQRADIWGVDPGEAVGP